MEIFHWILKTKKLFFVLHSFFCASGKKKWLLKFSIGMLHRIQNRKWGHKHFLVKSMAWWRLSWLSAQKEIWEYQRPINENLFQCPNFEFSFHKYIFSTKNVSVRIMKFQKNYQKVLCQSWDFEFLLSPRKKKFNNQNCQVKYCNLQNESFDSWFLFSYFEITCWTVEKDVWLLSSGRRTWICRKIAVTKEYRKLSRNKLCNTCWTLLGIRKFHERKKTRLDW